MDFNFMGEGKTKTKAKQIATGGKPAGFFQGLTKEQVAEAQALAGKGGLDINAFMKRCGIVELDVEQLLRIKIPKE